MTDIVLYTLFRDGVCAITQMYTTTEVYLAVWMPIHVLIIITPYTLNTPTCLSYCSCNLVSKSILQKGIRNTFKYEEKRHFKIRNTGFETNVSHIWWRWDIWKASNIIHKLGLVLISETEKTVVSFQSSSYLSVTQDVTGGPGSQLEGTFWDSCCHYSVSCSPAIGGHTDTRPLRLEWERFSLGSAL